MKDVKWFIHRLLSMNGAEMVWRVQQKLLQKKERELYFSVNKPVTEVALSAELNGRKADGERLGLHWDNDRYTLFEKQDLFGKYDYSLYKKKWNAGFQTENTWPTDVFSYDIALTQREDIGDIRTNWELNRHFQFVGLAKNYYVTRNESDLHELRELFEDWNISNPFLHGVQWTSAMEIAIRIVSWSYMLAFLQKSGVAEEFTGKIEHGIKVMAEYVVKHRSRYSSANNHLIVEMLGVGMAGILFDYDPWTDQALRILTEELPRQNFEDGVNREMSLHYQAFVMEAYGIFWLLLKKNQRSVAQSWKKYLENMSRFLADCCGDFGEVIVFGDNDEGKLLDFHGKIENYYQGVLQLMGMLLDKRYTSTELHENLYWLSDKKQQEEYAAKELYVPELVSHYKNGGYTILRSRDRRVLIGMDHAPLGFGKIAAHGHADALSIQVFYDGKPVLADSGTYNYHVPKSVRNEIRSVKAHNTVAAEGTEQAEMLGPFLWGKRYTAETAEIQCSAELVAVSACIGYEKIKHGRKLEFDFDRKFSVTDSLSGKKSGTQIWLFDSSFYKEKDRYSLELPEERVSHDVFYSDRYAHAVRGVRVDVFFKEKTKMSLTLR